MFFDSVCYLLINVLGYRPKISNKQFFSEGYAEQKMLLAYDVIQIVKMKHKWLNSMKWIASARSVHPRELAKSLTPGNNYHKRRTEFKKKS